MEVVGCACRTGKLMFASSQIWSIPFILEDRIEDRKLSSWSIILVEMRECIREWGDGFYPLRFEGIWKLDERG